MVEGEILKNGIAAATIEDGYFGECNDDGNDSMSLYGWQDFGAYSLFSGGFPNAICPKANKIASGTPLPIARSMTLASQFASPGDHILGTTVSQSLQNVRAYASKGNAGYTFMLFNLDGKSPVTFTVGVTNAFKQSFVATMTTYGKAQYDRSKMGVWAGTVTGKGRTVKLPFPVTLPAWSMNVLTLR